MEWIKANKWLLIIVFAILVAYLITGIDVGTIYTLGLGIALIVVLAIGVISIASKGTSKRKTYLIVVLLLTILIGWIWGPVYAVLGFLGGFGFIMMSYQ